MNGRKRTLVAFVFVLLLTLSLAGCAQRGAGLSGGGSSSGGSSGPSASDQTGSGGAGSGGGRTYEMKIGLATANDAQDAVANLYADEINKAAGGRIKAQVYNGSQLGDNTQMNQQAQAGTLEALLQPTGFMVPFVPEFGVLDLPFLFSDYKEMRDVLASSAMTPFNEAAEKRGFVNALFWPYSEGMRALITRDPIRSLDDIKGKKFRVFPAPELIGQFESWGASAVPMSLVEVYTALQQGTIDGLDNPADVTYRMKHHEAAPYFTVTDHGALANQLVISKTWFDQLPADLQEIVLKSATAILPEVYKVIEESHKTTFQALKDDPKVTVTEMPEAELEKMKEAVKPVWDKDRSDPDKGPLLKALEEEMAK